MKLNPINTYNQSMKAQSNPNFENINFQGKKGIRQKIADMSAGTTLSIMLIAPVAVGTVAKIHNSYKNSDDFPTYETVSEYNKTNIEKSFLKNRLMLTDAIDGKLINDICDYRIANSPQINYPVQIKDIKEIDGKNILFEHKNRPVADFFRGAWAIPRQQFLEFHMRGILTKVKKNPKEAQELATQLAYLIKNGQIQNGTQDSWRSLLEFTLDPTRKPTEAEIKEMQDLYGVDWLKLILLTEGATFLLLFILQKPESGSGSFSNNVDDGEPDLGY